ncbi:MAG: C39 family peptidase [Finegoldia sp.]|uniref:C39 family peptidase n=1 Tax=Finegoldia sp. TaxID=1981334 RepID=UPI0039932B8D
MLKNTKKILTMCILLSCLIQNNSYAINNLNTSNDVITEKLIELDNKSLKTKFLINNIIEKKHRLSKKYENEQSFKDVIYFNQTDPRFAYTPYGDGEFGIVQNTGCGPTSMAMVVSTLTKTYTDPNEIASWAMFNGYNMGNNGSSWELFPAAARKYGLDYMFSYSIEDARECLKTGGLVILSQNSSLNNYWTNSGHFIVLTGFENDLYTVNDPYSIDRTERYHTENQVFTPNKAIFCFWK